MVEPTPPAAAAGQRRGVLIEINGTRYVCLCAAKSDRCQPGLPAETEGVI